VRGRDICVAGRCGCSGDVACGQATNPHPSATPVCDPRP
jgi:hypothetical protein